MAEDDALGDPRRTGRVDHDKVIVGLEPREGLRRQGGALGDGGGEVTPAGGRTADVQAGCRHGVPCRGQRLGEHRRKRVVADEDGSAAVGDHAAERIRARHPREGCHTGAGAQGAELGDDRQGGGLAENRNPVAAADPAGLQPAGEAGDGLRARRPGQGRIRTGQGNLVRGVTGMPVDDVRQEDAGDIEPGRAHAAAPSDRRVPKGEGRESGMPVLAGVFLSGRRLRGIGLLPAAGPWNQVDGP